MTKQSHDLLTEIIQKIETYCLIEKIDHRFVGGVSYGGLLNEKTHLKIDLPNKEVELVNHNPLTMVRDDHTLRDIDLIFLTTEPKKIFELKKFIAALKREVRPAIGQTPSISFEGPVPRRVTKPKGFLRFVTVIEIQKTALFLRFDTIRQQISRTSLEPWTVILEDGLRFTTRNPIADYFAYQFRSPSGVKPKDQEKLIHLEKVVRLMVIEGKKYDIDFFSKEYYKPWLKYQNKLAKNQSISVTSTKMLTSWYWSTIGTDLAHGKGIVRKSILAFFNLVTRLRQ